ncbi:hypothetical protein GMRT_13123 [Giardia muris]|uniref:Uncharacterized protein n=1 Tax=Giardia muris TaxID=5742 RepID=A0A4Z1SXN7_GIAMU|nr:hypothetical protein GMRT_13123 [Giardia muris]|eukprot:TNJ30532.1 hypothetical protein GMRT_13123 [Giardia muris]
MSRIRSFVVVSIQGNTHVLNVSLREEMTLQEVVFVALTGCALSKSPVTDYDHYDLFHVLTRGQVNYFQWQPRAYMVVRDLHAYQRQRQCDLDHIYLFIKAGLCVPQLRYGYTGMGALSDLPERSALYRDVCYTLADLRAEVALKTQGLDPRTQAEELSTDYGVMLRGRPQSPEAAICKDLRGMHPLPLVLPMNLTAPYYRAFLDERGATFFSVRTVSLPVPRSAIRMLEEPRTRTYLEVTVAIPVASIFGLFLMPLVCIFKVMFHILCVFGLAHPYPAPPAKDLVLSIRLSCTGIFMAAATSLWYLVMSYLLNFVRITSMRSFTNAYLRIFAFVYGSRVLMHGISSILPVPMLISLLRLADPVGEMGSVYHVFYDELFRETAPRRAYGGYSRVQMAPQLGRAVANRAILSPPTQLQRAWRLAKLFVGSLMPGFVEN